PVQHRKRLQDKERKHRRNGQRTNLRRHNARVLELLRCHRQQKELGAMGNTELWKRPAWADNDHGTWSLTQQVQEHPGFWSILAMSQKMEHQPIPLREGAHEIFATAKSVAGKAEAEIILVSRIDEYLRFGNNELAQSQYSTSRNLPVKIASDK